MSMGARWAVPSHTPPAFPTQLFGSFGCGGFLLYQRSLVSGGSVEQIEGSPKRSQHLTPAAGPSFEPALGTLHVRHCDCGN